MYHAKDGSASPHAFSPTIAIGLVLAAMATLIAIGILVGATGAPLYAAMALGQLAMLALPWIAARRTGRHPAAALGLRAPAGRFVAAAVLVGASAWYVNLRLVEALEIPHGDTRPLQQLIERPSLAVVLLSIAVAPAVCEEVLFRGVLARALATRYAFAIAVVASAAVFSLYHLKPIQMVPTFTLGIVLAVIALRADSIVPTVIAHFLNNAIALLVARDEIEPVTRALGSHPGAALAGFAILTATGVALVSLRTLIALAGLGALVAIKVLALS